VAQAQKGTDAPRIERVCFLPDTAKMNPMKQTWTEVSVHRLRHAYLMRVKNETGNDRDREVFIRKKDAYKKEDIDLLCVHGEGVRWID
jgi:hypothetical protein